MHRCSAGAVGASIGAKPEGSGRCAMRLYSQSVTTVRSSQAYSFRGNTLTEFLAPTGIRLLKVARRHELLYLPHRLRAAACRCRTYTRHVDRPRSPGAAAASEVEVQ